MATTKREIVRRVALKTRQRQNVARVVIQTFLNEVVEELAKGNRLEFREFGVFDVIRKKPRIARNPRTGAQVQVPAKTVVHFKVGRMMKEKVRRIQAEKSTAEERVPASSSVVGISQGQP